jgi:hypothetical protein
MHVPDLHWNSEDLKVNRRISGTILAVAYFTTHYFFFVFFSLLLLNENYFPKIFFPYHDQ